MKQDFEATVLSSEVMNFLVLEAGLKPREFL